jgi:hypothetical protein
VRTAAVRLATIGPLGADDFATDAAGRTFQVCRAAVQTPEGEIRVALHWPVAADPTSSSLASLTELTSRNSPGIIAALVRESAEGRVTAEVDQTDEVHAPAVAAAAAIMRVSWAWDESATIAVAVNGKCIPLAPRFNGEVWQTVEIGADAIGRNMDADAK